MLNASKRFGDGYAFWDGTQWWWYNDHDGPGAGSSIPQYGQGRRHYFVDTGFTAVHGSDRNYTEFMQRFGQWYPDSLPFVEIAAGGAIVQSGGGGGGGTGAAMTPQTRGWFIQGDGRAWAEIISEGLAAIGTLPVRPDLVPGDNTTNWENVFLYSQALAAHARRDEIIRLFGEGIGFALDKMGQSSIRAPELVRIVGKSFAVLSKLPEAPEVIDSSVADADDTNFDNFFDYLAAEAAYWKRDEAIKAVANIAEEVLTRRAA